MKVVRGGEDVHGSGPIDEGEGQEEDIGRVSGWRLRSSRGDMMMREVLLVLEIVA